MISILFELLFCIANAFVSMQPNLQWWQRGISLSLCVLLGAMAVVDTWAKAKGFDK